MPFFRRSPFAARRVLRLLDRLDARLAEQNSYLRRLADAFAPQYAVPSDADLHTQTSVDFLNREEAGRVLDFIDRVSRDQGRMPTEEEILVHLAEEATTALHTPAGERGRG